MIVLSRCTSLTLSGCCRCSVTQQCPTLCNLMDYSKKGFPVPHHLLNFAQVHVHCTGDVIQPSHPLTPSSPSALNLFQHQGLFLWVSCSHHMKNTGASASVLPMNTQDWFPLRLTGLILLSQKTLKRLLQPHSSKTSTLKHSIAFTVQLSQSCVTTGKTIALTIRTFVGRVTSLLFNTLSRFVVAFLTRSNHLLISWLQSPSAVILEPKKRKSVTTSTFPPLLVMK